MEWNQDLQKLYEDINAIRQNSSNSQASQYTNHSQTNESTFHWQANEVQLTGQWTCYLRANERQLGIYKQSLLASSFHL